MLFDMPPTNSVKCDVGGDDDDAEDKTYLILGGQKRVSQQKVQDSNGNRKDTNYKTYTEIYIRSKKCKCKK